ncbi:MAG: AraC family transcriptional regulator [Proteobacteria bacterium]|nr:AraC family transcriptional regulator [Pseudomonadota bacterium]
MKAAHPLSNFVTLETDSIEVVRDAMTRAYCRHRVHTEHWQPKIAARHHEVTLSTLSLHYLTYGMEITVCASELPDFFLLDLPLSGHCSYRVGSREFTSGEGLGCVVSPGLTLQTKWSCDTALMAVKVPRAVLERHLADTLECTITEPLRFEPEFDYSFGARASLRALVDFLVLELDRHDAMRHTPLWCAQMERAVAMGLLTTQRHNYTEALEAQVTNPGPRYLLRAEAFIRANLSNEVGIAEIATAAGVPERTLFAAYRKHKGLSPIAHYRALRLQAARDNLVRPEPADTVASIACRWGFYHLGHFSRDYYRRFGERPSETLKAHC